MTKFFNRLPVKSACLSNVDKVAEVGGSKSTRSISFNGPGRIVKIAPEEDDEDDDN